MVKILIVDDEILFRKIIASALIIGGACIPDNPATIARRNHGKRGVKKVKLSFKSMAKMRSLRKK